MFKKALVAVVASCVAGLLGVSAPAAAVPPAATTKAPLKVTINGRQYSPPVMKKVDSKSYKVTKRKTPNADYQPIKHPVKPVVTAGKKPVIAKRGSAAAHRQLARGFTDYHYSYAGGWQFNYGSGITSVAANFSVDNPWVETSTGFHEHSVTEIAVIRDDGDGYRQIVEVGWGTNINNNSDLNTRLWSGIWVDGNWFGYNDNSWGYNSYCEDDPCTYPQGNDVLVAAEGSSLSAKDFTIQHDDTTDAWWVGYNGHWFAYYYDTIWTGAEVSPAFTAGGYYDVFGEYVTNYDGDGWGDMGNSQFPSATVAGAATITSITVNGSGSGVTTTSHITNSSLYDLKYIVAGSPPVTSVRSFRYGGDGVS